MSKTVDVVVTYLERELPGASATAPRSAEPVRHATPVPLELHHIAPPEAAVVAAMLYRAVGAPWHWTDRLPWTEAEWQAAVNRSDVEPWVARIDGEIGGYFELSIGDDAVELSYLGLMPEYTGRRLGGALLAAAIDRAAATRSRMTVNTCTLDHSAALPNYLKHGFSIVRTVTQRRELAS